jgi:hypothetical protein
MKRRNVIDLPDVDFRFLDLVDVVAEKLPAELSYRIRLLKQRNVNDLPDAQVELKE